MSETSAGLRVVAPLTLPTLKKTKNGEAKNGNNFKKLRK
jgi:hypothetical protein